MLSVVMLRGMLFFIYWHAECRYDVCYYAECRYAEYYYAECRGA
jgi:hypothetical protein